MQFKGNIHTRQKHYHSYTTDNFALKELGIASYTLSSLDGYLKDSNPDVAAFFSSPSTASVNLKGNSTESLEILHFEKFDPENSRYVLQRGAEIFTYIDEFGIDNANLASMTLPRFLQLYDRAVLDNAATISLGEDFSANRKDILSVAEKIQSSYSGCINFIASFSAIGIAQTANIQVRLLNLNSSNDSRTIGMRGSPIIVDVGKSISGKDISIQGTSDSPAGVMQRPYGGGIDNPKDSVAAAIDLRFNSNTGKWQGGTHQSLARLLTDVDPAQIGPFSELSSNSSEIYDNPESNWKIIPSPGQCVFLEMQNGNPYMYGPNFIGCPLTGAKEPDAVVCSNRSSASFKKGEVVLLSYISGEWIIQKYGGEPSNRPTKLGRWQFQKFIVNSDNFFKDARGKSPETIAGNETNSANYRQNISPNIYETKMRTRYYVNLLRGPTPNHSLHSANTLAKINLFTEELKDSYESQIEMLKDIDKVIKKELPSQDKYDIMLSSYYQSTIFDQVGSNLGGVNPEGAVIGRTNLKYSPNKVNTDADGYVMQSDLANFWGPVFPDGYTGASVKNAKNKNGLNMKINNTNFYIFFGPGFDGVVNLDNTDKDGFVPLENRMFSDSSDVNLLQLPAEIALNGSFKKYSYPIEGIFFDAGVSFDGSQDNIAQYFYNFLQDPERYSYLYTTNAAEIDEDLYSLTPVNPKSIQFSPLQFGTALSFVDITNEEFLTNPARGYSNLNAEIRFIRGTIQNARSDNDEGEDSDTDHTGNPLLFFPATFMARHDLSKKDLVTRDNQVAGTSYIKFGPFVNLPDKVPRPLGGPRYIPLDGYSDERSNLIGIIAAKNKFSAGGNVVFTTRQEFGLPPQVTIAGGQGPQVTILGAFLGWNTPGNPLRTNSVPQWGDSTRSDRYDSFGTTALHVRVFDEWPDEQTFYDGRYFAVLHFNPFTRTFVSAEDTLKYSKLYGASFKGLSRRGSILQVEIQRGNSTVFLDIQETSVDFRVPPLTFGAVVTKDTILSNPSEWKIDPVRRGALLTGGGFRYPKKVIGAGTIRVRPAEGDTSFLGKDYKKDDIISFSNGVKVKITSDGTIGNFEIIDKGEGFLPSSFNSPIRSKSDDGSGSGGVLEIVDGLVYEKYLIDKGPEERIPITRLSLPSTGFKTKLLENDGDVARGTLITNLNIDGGNGKYDAFYFMHNDILHTQTTGGAFHPGFAQYINLEIA